MVNFFRIGLLLLAFIYSFQAYSEIGIDKWRTHYSYNNVTSVTVADDITYAVANGKLFSINQDNNIGTYSTITGLSGFDISFLDWCKELNSLVIVYSDGNIDIIEKNRIYNISDFKNKSVTADKTVNNLRLEGKFAYMSTGLGLLKIDLLNKEIDESYSIVYQGNNVKVYDSAILNDTIYLITNHGLFAGNKKNNLIDPANWNKGVFIDNLKPLSIIQFSDKLFCYAENGNLYHLDQNNWKLFKYNPDITRIDKEEDYLYLCSNSSFSVYNKSLELFYSENYPGNDLSYSKITGKLFVASGKQGLSVFKNENNSFIFEKSKIRPNGPGQTYAWNSFFHNGKYYSTAGGRWGDRYNTEGEVMIFDNEKWTGLKNKSEISVQSGNPFLDVLNIAIDPKDEGHFYLTSWGEGLYEFRDSVFYKLHNQYNSPLVTMIDNYRFCRVDGAKFDKDGNLWVLNSTYGLNIVSDTTIWILKPNGTWEGLSYNNMPAAPTWNSIYFTSSNQVWINSVRVTYGLFVLDYNNTPFDKSDDKTRWFSTFTDQEGKTISPYTINCITEDKNGSIWIGTREGPLVAGNPSNVFNNNFYFTRIKIPRNDGTNLADYLLNDIRVNCITVDGANRKWIGTEGNGVYLLSSDGTATIHNFNTTNSPLPSDYIYSISIDPNSGEVFIGTDAGLVSYRSDAIEGKNDYSDIHVFPNPVKPQHTGRITVTGLKEGSQVKITDLSGNLLVSGRSLGGQFVWNGINSKGKRAASGVYLVFCASEDGSIYATTRFMIVN